MGEEKEKEMVTFEELRPGMKLENKACRWEILGVPKLHSVHPQWGVQLSVRARCEFKAASYPAKEVDLKGYVSEELEVSL
jgi:hypothetical protein